MNEPVMSSMEYGSAPEGMEDMLEEMCKDKTADQLSQMSDYFSRKASDMRSKLSKEIKYEDIEACCKGDRE